MAILIMGFLLLRFKEKGKPMNIFIIEDDRVLRTELMKLLCSYGYQCD